MRITLIIIASFLLLLGSISMLSPLPGGTLMLAAGLALLICSSEKATNWLLHLRTRNNKLNRIMGWMEDHAGQRLGSILRQTRPDERV